MILPSGVRFLVVESSTLIKPDIYEADICTESKTYRISSRARNDSTRGGKNTHKNIIMAEAVNMDELTNKV